jgi:mitochondrial fission process protein 1
MTTNKTLEDIKTIMALYDEDGDGKLSPQEMLKIKEAFRQKHGVTYDVMKRRYLHNLDLDELPDSAIQLLSDDVHTTDLAMRYLAFTGFVARIVRYLAYTSDFGEAFRPIAHPLVVKASYGVSWAYVISDVSYEAYNMSYNHGITGPDFYVTTAKRAVFQSIASMALPAFTIHTVVHESKKFFKRIGRFQKWGPSALGLSIVPFLPLYDHPVETAVDKLFGYFYTPKHPALQVHH